MSERQGGFVLGALIFGLMAVAAVVFQGRYIAGRLDSFEDRLSRFESKLDEGIFSEEWIEQQEAVDAEPASAD